MDTPINSWPRPPRSVRVRIASIALSSLLLLLLAATGTHPVLARATSTGCQSFKVPVAYLAQVVEGSEPAVREPGKCTDKKCREFKKERR